MRKCDIFQCFKTSLSVVYAVPFTTRNIISLNEFMEFVEYSAGMCLSKNKTTKQNKSKKQKKQNNKQKQKQNEKYNCL